MHADSCRLDPFVTRGLTIYRSGSPDIDTELVFAQPRRNIRMCLRKHVRIDPERDTGAPLQLRSALGYKFQLAFAFDIEEQDVRPQSEVDLGSCLADSRKNNAVCRS